MKTQIMSSLHALSNLIIQDIYRQRSDSTGRTVLQTVVQKMEKCDLEFWNMKCHAVISVTATIPSFKQNECSLVHIMW